mgnify:CR=1 FL=1
MTKEPKIHYSQIEYLIELSQKVGLNYTENDVKDLTFSEYMAVKQLLEYVYDSLDSIYPFLSEVKQWEKFYLEESR